MSAIAIAPQLSGPVSPRSRQAAVRLTRRGKIVVIAAAFAVIALLTLVLGPSVAATGQTGAPQETTTVKVMAGETLWQIASEANPHGDIRDTVDDIVRLNSLPSGSAVQPGMHLAVPVY